MNTEITNEECKYKRHKLEHIGVKPIQSIGTYTSLDAECIVGGSSDRVLRFLDVDDLEEIAKTTVNKKSVNCVAVSEMTLDGDDPIIITGGKDSSIQIWNPTSGNLEKNIELPTTEVRSLCIYQGSVTYVLIGTKDAKVILWDVRNDNQIAIYEGHRASIHSVSITSSVQDTEINKNNSNDLNYLCIASGGADRTARTWDYSSGKKKKKFRHSRSISTMVVANKGLRPILATGGVERVIKLWDVNTGILLRSLEGHLDQINSITLWEGYQMLLISASSDHTVRIYDMVTGECICLLIGHEDAVLGCTLANYDEPKIVSSSEDLCLIQWDLDAIIKDLYHIGGEDIGARNMDIPPYLPPYYYEAPVELDKDELTKEQRKAIRKEMKKEKRKKNNEKFQNKNNRNSIIHNHNNIDCDGDGDDEYNYDNDNDIGYIDDEDISEPSYSLPTSTTNLHEILKLSSPSSKTATESKSQTISRATATTNNSSGSSSGSNKSNTGTSVVKSVMKAIFGVDNSVGIEPISTTIMSDEVLLSHKLNKQKITTARTSKDNDDGKDNDDDNDDGNDNDDNCEDKFKIGMNEDSTNQLSSSVAVAVVASYTEDELRQLAAKKGKDFSKAVVTSEIEKEKSKNQAAAKLKLRLKLKKGIGAKNDLDASSSSSHDVDENNKSSSSNSNRNNNTSSSSGVDGGGGGEGFNDDSNDHDNNNDDSNIHDDNNASSYQSPSSSSSSSTADENIEMELLKQDKLMEHKLQEQRRYQSMVLAKNKAAESLQKRLNEIAARKASVIEEDDGEEDGDDSD